MNSDDDRPLPLPLHMSPPTAQNMSTSHPPPPSSSSSSALLLQHTTKLPKHFASSPTWTVMMMSIVFNMVSWIPAFFAMGLIFMTSLISIFLTMGCLGPLAWLWVENLSIAYVQLETRLLLEIFKAKFPPELLARRPRPMNLTRHICAYKECMGSCMWWPNFALKSLLSFSAMFVTFAILALNIFTLCLGVPLFGGLFSRLAGLQLRLNWDVYMATTEYSWKLNRDAQSFNPSSDAPEVFSSEYEAAEYKKTGLY